MKSSTINDDNSFGYRVELSDSPKWRQVKHQGNQNVRVLGQKSTAKTSLGHGDDVGVEDD